MGTVKQWMDVAIKHKRIALKKIMFDVIVVKKVVSIRSYSKDY